MGKIEKKKKIVGKIDVGKIILHKNLTRSLIHVPKQ